MPSAAGSFITSQGLKYSGAWLGVVVVGVEQGARGGGEAHPNHSPNRKPTPTPTLNPNPNLVLIGDDHERARVRGRGRGEGEGEG